MFPLLYASKSVSRLLTNSTEQSPSWEAKSPQLVKKFPAFYRIRRCISAFTSARHQYISCVRSIESTPPHPTSWRSTLILSSLLRLVFQVVSFPQVYQPEPCMRLFCLPYVPQAVPIISFFLVWSPEWYVVRSWDHKALRYVVFSIPLLLRLSYAQISFSAPYSRTPSAHVSPSIWETKFYTPTKQQAKL